MGIGSKFPSGKPIPKRLKKGFKKEIKMVRRTTKGRRTKKRKKGK